MWLSRQMKAPAPTADADLGMTTIAGDSVGVVTRGEVRALPVYGPGGYVWMPESGAAVLVIKGGPGGEEQCVAGQQQALIPEGMGPGEVYLFTPGGNSVYLRSGGEIELRGKVRIQGSLTVNGEPYAPCESWGGMEGGRSLRDGDDVPDGTGGLRRTEGREALLEQVLFRLTARRGTFPFLPELGSRLWQLGQLPAARRQSAAEQYVAEALAAEPGLTVEQVILTESGGGRAQVTVGLTWQGEALSVTVEVS